MSTWSPADIPDQSGRTVVATGASSGIGFHAACELAGRGARVVLAVRDTAKGHPGYAHTNLVRTGSRAMDLGGAVLNRVVAQSAEAGSWPTLCAATMDLPAGFDHVGG